MILRPQLPAELAAIDGDRERCGKKALGHRTDLEDGAGVDWLAAFFARQTPWRRRAVAGDDADSEAGAVESGHALGNVAFKLIRTLREKITSDESR